MFLQVPGSLLLVQAELFYVQRGYGPMTQYNATKCCWSKACELLSFFEITTPKKLCLSVITVNF
jgi:hypothetical protein